MDTHHSLKEGSSNVSVEYLKDVASVKLIGITQPVVDYIPDSEGIISYAARVSNPSNQTNFDTASKLLQYCVKHKHWSVFETVNVVMEIKVPRDIGRQILRHKSFTFQEFSQRYAEAQDFCIRDARSQDNKNRQNSNDNLPENVREWWEEAQQKILDIVTETYNQALSQGIAKECARVILPEGNTMSVMYMNGTLRSWLHYCDLRCSNGTQKEHMVIASLARNILIENFPFLEEYYKE